MEKNIIDILKHEKHYPVGIREVDRIIINHQTGKWCRLPYPNHPSGCPNFGKKQDCPPLALPIEKMIDLEKPVYLAFSEFNVRAHAIIMGEKYPKWTERQRRNLLYWQPKSRKQAELRARLARHYGCGDTIITCPEGHGVNVYATCALAGLRLEKIRRLIICLHVALIGFKHG